MITLKKTLKIKYVGFWEGFNPDNNILCKTIKKFYDIEESDDPDYIICSVFQNSNNDYFEYCNYPQVRIMFSGENYIPDFNIVDYAISSYPVKLQDRHLHYPYCLNDFNAHCSELVKKERNYSLEFLKKKIYFANFIASHDSENNIRGDFFKSLNEYKRVESPGSFLNNMQNGYCVNHLDTSKVKFQRKCKFTLCFESTRHEGFITEKITDAFFADTIPVYYGSSDVNQIFNSEAFINCSDYPSFDEVKKKIIELDQDDEKYLDMLNKPIFVDDSIVLKKEKELDAFVKNIFEQPLEDTFRRSRVYTPKNQEIYLQRIIRLKNRYENTSILDDFSIRVLLQFLKKKIKVNFRITVKYILSSFMRGLRRIIILMKKIAERRND